ncbi:hypothetical protein F3Y22_tig00110458pilonHSYRG00093 [Hibiscus syriacus]|uniref:Uncharacterized protein n=1 Tax=Hibiscus syriacus TaxID=106335 RepID=A0A6A3AHV5_HIBSY|nr:hypothetical protein F3Y22_tig00110458pilonHSYRG00093 [Hibiscus syriacus]
MSRIAFVVFSMALIISMQFMGGQSKEETPKEEKKDNKESVPGVNKEEDKQVTEKIVGRYGEVLSVYIPKKRSRAGTSCISVSCAIYSLKVPKEANQVCASRKEVMGNVDENGVRKLRRCLVGVMAGVCSVWSIVNRLHNWGLGEIKVQILRGNSFLRTIEDEDLFIMLEDLQWSYLKEIFMDIMLWTESICQMERVVWIEIDGLPLHYWNEVTLKRLVGLWGRFEAFGENVNHHIDFEKVNMLISTSTEARIDETVDVEKEIEDEKDGVEVGADKEGVSSANFSVDPSEASELGSSVNKKGSPLSDGSTFDVVGTGDSIRVRNKVNVGKLIEVGCGIEEGRERVSFQISDHSNHMGLQGLDIDGVLQKIGLLRAMGLQAEDLMDLHSDSMATSRGMCDGIKLGPVNYTEKGRSLLNSNLKKRWFAAYVEVDETLSVAKILGIKFVGPRRKDVLDSLKQMDLKD